MKRELFIVIPVHNRINLLRELLDELDYDPDHIILVDNNSEPPLNQILNNRGIIICDAERNIQHLWNIGWKLAEGRANGPYAIAFLNSDAFANSGTLYRMVDALDDHNASVVGADRCEILQNMDIYRKTIPGPVDWCHTMTGYGFVVRGELTTRFDEQFVWWYGDPDFDWRARQQFGGSVILGGAYIGNRDQDGAQRDFPELHAQTDKDRITFINKWGRDSS